MPNDPSNLPAVLFVPRTEEGYEEISVSPGTTTTFCGANGSGKTRLAVYIEQKLGLAAHRISAHRALSLNPAVPKISEQEALSGLRTGYMTRHVSSDAGQIRPEGRWKSHEATLLLNDYDLLVQALFAEQSNTALNSHNRLRAGPSDSTEPTKFEQLAEIWGKLLPHCRLEISGDDIAVRVPGNEAHYPASEMSDGERATFYLLGQTLVAADRSVLIVDEPELHLHPSIMSLLWDELAVVRPDCAFVFVTHSLEFAASRPGNKYLVRDYQPGPAWTIDPVPEGTGFSEEFTTLILGSRRPVLFVEGTTASLDPTIYSALYPDHLVLPRGSCEAVIHAVASMRSNAALTRVECCGIVDGDHRSDEEIRRLRDLGVAVLPVADVENVFLLPEVSRAIAVHEGHEGDGIDEQLTALRQAVFDSIAPDDQRRTATLQYVARQADRHVKRVDLGKAASIEEVEAIYANNAEALDIHGLASDFECQIATAIDNEDLPRLLAYYGNKGLLALAAKHLKDTKLDSFKDWLNRILRQDSAPKLATAIRNALPKLP